MKEYHQSPLPFQGQKRNFIKKFKPFLNAYSHEYLFIDLFGRSGLLSHTVKCRFPEARVIYNDFDNFQKRLNAIESTNKILSELRTVLKNYPREKRIIGDKRIQVLETLKKYNDKGDVDWITLSSSLMFSMNYGICLKHFTNDSLYNKIRLSDYNADGYLAGVEVVKSDYKDLFEKHKKLDKVVFLVDPPYLNTDVSTYGSRNYWKLKDYLNVLQVLRGQNYFYFISNKSHIIELCEWISSLSTTETPFANAECEKQSTSTTYNTGYVDIMYHYKKQKKEV